jgi:hypothetical protein
MGDIYNGPAHLIRDDGSEIPVTANLRAFTGGPRTGWSGVLTAAPQHHVVLANTDHGRLRLKDGGDESFVCIDPSTWVTAGQTEIHGNNEAPF